MIPFLFRFPVPTAAGITAKRRGTGDRPAGQELADWVLGHCTAEEKPLMEAAFDHAAETAVLWVQEGIEKAMQKGNSR